MADIPISKMVVPGSNDVLVLKDSSAANKVLSPTSGNLAGLDANGNLTDSGVAKTDIDDMQDELSTDTSTATGNLINFITKTAQNAESTIIDLEPIQDLHGYDKPWVGGAGKNKLGFLGDTTIGDSCFTVEKDNDNNILGAKLSFVPAQNTYFGNAVSLKAGSYRLSGCPSSGSTSTYSLTIRRGTINGAYVGNADVGSGSDVTIPSDDTYYITLYVAANKGSVGLQFRPMFRLSTETDPTFAPYTNICPITGRTEIGILGCGKNLFDSSSVEQGSINQTTGQDEPNNYVKRSGYLPVSGNNIFLNSPGGTMRIFFYDKYKNYLSNEAMQTKEYSMTLPNGTFYIRCIGVNDLFNSNIMISAGADDVPYSPYTKSTDLTISLGQTVYGGTLDIENGVLVVADKIEDLSNLSWNYGAVDDRWVSSVVSDIQNPDSTSDATTAIFEKYQSASLIYQNTHLNEASCATYNSKFYLRNLSSTVAPDGDCVYPLATPITINLTPHQISLLEDVNNISTTGDKITLTYRDGKVATLGDLKELQDYVDSKPSGGGHNYSTEEQVVGTWIDGKPVYEKAFSVDIQTDGNNWVDTGAVVPNIENIVKYDLIGIDRYVGNVPANIPGYVRYYNNLQVYLNLTWNITFKVIILQYTKTTD